MNTDGAGSKDKVAQRKWELNRLGKMKRILIIRRVDLGHFYGKRIISKATMT